MLVLLDQCAKGGGRIGLWHRGSVGGRRREDQLVSQKYKYSTVSTGVISIEKQVEVSSVERNA